MRDSNYSFPAQNRVCVSITAQLYDRRGESRRSCWFSVSVRVEADWYLGCISK